MQPTNTHRVRVSTLQYYRMTNAPTNIVYNELQNPSCDMWAYFDSELQLVGGDDIEGEVQILCYSCNKEFMSTGEDVCPECSK